MEYLKFVFQAWKAIEIWFGSWKVTENENYCIRTWVSLRLEQDRNKNSADW